MASILQIQEEAKDRGFDNAQFFISAPRGVFVANWVDAYLGFFCVVDVNEDNTFTSVRDIPKHFAAFWERADADAHHAENFAFLRGGSL